MALDLQEHVPLAPHTTLRLGGAARYWAVCATEDDIREALAFATARKLPVQILGGGSNVIVADRGFPGVVVRVDLRGLSFQDNGQGTDLVAAAGEEWDAVVAASVRRGLSGIECLSGIPGLVGGTPIQNVGAYGQEIAETLRSVTCLDRTILERVTFSEADCEFAYRSSRFKRRERDRFVVLGVTLRLGRGVHPTLRYPELFRAVAAESPVDGLSPAQAVRTVREVVLTLRRRKSMVVDPGDPNSCSAGSFFLNPVLNDEAFNRLRERWEARGDGTVMPQYPAPEGVKIPAAWLVEQAGFAKGHRRDGVGISTRHALALVNLGSGTARELLELAEAIQGAVRERFGVELEREPVLVG